MIYDYIIVGAGISGLNTGIEILKRNSKTRVVILERNSYRTGGRVFTDKFKIGKQQYALDAGAGRFSDTHKRLLGLIDRYKLSDKVYKLSKKANFIETREYSSGVIIRDANEIVKRILDKVDKMSNKKRQQLKNMTFKELVTELFNQDTADFLQASYPYYSEVALTNAYSAIGAFKNDLMSSKNYFILFGGLSQITEKMTAEYLSLGGRLVNSFEVTAVEKKENGVFSVDSSNENVKRAKNIVFTTPKNVLEKISYLKPLKREFKALNCVPLYRIYAVYPVNPETGKVWFHDIPRTITDSRIKYIIPINPEQGSIMISYTDAIHADYWHKVPDDKLVTRLHREVTRVYPDIPNIPEPLIVKKYFWNPGACFYKKDTDPDYLREYMVNPMENVFICGDSFSSHQAWMEGALETSELVIKSIFKK
jgi:monoamine oxidase